jgi:hypothetical protein
VRTPPPVAGRKHENVQTENYLEEVSQYRALFDYSERRQEVVYCASGCLFVNKVLFYGMILGLAGFEMETING